MMMIDVVSTSETSINFYQTARRNIPESSSKFGQFLQISNTKSFQFLTYSLFMIIFQLSPLLKQSTVFCYTLIQIFIPFGYYVLIVMCHKRGIFCGFSITVLVDPAMLFSLLSSKRKVRLMRSSVCLSVCMSPLITFEPIGRFYEIQ
jgi:hypothetical protein